MAIRDLYMTASGMTDLISVDLTEGYAQAAAMASVECVSHTLTIGDAVAALDVGWADDHAVLMTNSIVKKIAYNRPQNTYTLQIHDRLSLAVDYYMASDDPDSPFMASNVEASVLVGQLLAQAGLTSYSGDATPFTFAPTQPTPINLISAWDAIESICRITGLICYMQSDGTVRFTTRKPYITGDVSAYALQTGSGSNIEEIEYEVSDEGLRNRVVVYGGRDNQFNASASAASPYLPANFYKTIVVAHELIGSTAQCQATADLNLTLFNRLTENLRVRAIGDPGLRVRGIVDVTDSFAGLTADEFVVYTAQHTLSKDGFSSELVLVR
jgi:phage protein D